MSFKPKSGGTILDSNGEVASVIPADQAKAKESLSDADKKELKRIISSCMIFLYTKYPFYGLLLDRSDILITYQVPTAAMGANGKMYVNPEFFLDLGSEAGKKGQRKQRIFVLAHEILHAALAHHQRRGNRNPKLWNYAADYLINDMLTKDLGSDGKPESALYIHNLNEDLTSEDVFCIIDDIQKKKQGNKQGNPRGSKLRDENPQTSNQIENDLNNGLSERAGDIIFDELDGETVREGAGETPESREEWNDAIAQAATRAKMMGKLPAHVELKVGKFLKPKVDWAKKLVSTITREVANTNRSDYSWLRPNRRFLGQDLIFPSMIGHSKKVCTWVDTSGSMSANWLQAASDIEAIRKRYQIKTYHCWQDAEVYPEGWLDPNDPFPQMAAGGGGTSFVPVFDHLKETGIIDEIDCIVGFTDMWGTFPEDPGIPVIWVSFSDTPAPFGTLITVKESDFS